MAVNRLYASGKKPIAAYRSYNLLIAEMFPRLKQRIARGFRRYYVQQHFSSHWSKQAQMLLTLLHSLQLLTLLLPLRPTEGDPWNYSVFWPCWYVLNALGRQDRMLQTLVSPVRVTEYIYGGLVVWRFTTLVLSVLRYGYLKKAKYWKIVSGKPPKRLMRWLDGADGCGILLLSRLLAIPAVNTLAEAALNESSQSLFAVAALVLTLTDTFFLVDISVSPTSVGPITPHFALWIAACDLSAAVLTASDNPVAVSILLLICGAVKTAVVVVALPFHFQWRNQLECWQGVGLMWEAALLLLAKANPQAIIAPSLLLFLILPLLFTLSYRLLKAHIKAYLKRGIATESHYAFALLQTVNIPYSGEENSLRKQPLFANSQLTDLRLYPLLWTAYYYINSSEYYLAKLVIGIISEKKRNWPNSVQIETCVSRLHAILHRDHCEKTLQSCLLLDSLLSNVGKQDDLTTAHMHHFYECIEHQSVRFPRLALLSHDLSQYANKAEHLYQVALKTFPKRPTLHRAYSSFLQMLGKLQKAEQYSRSAVQIYQSKERNAASILEASVNDDMGLIAVVPLTGPLKGIIEWSRNAFKLNYTDEMLKEQLWTTLLPTEMQGKHSEMLLKTTFNGLISLNTDQTADFPICVVTREREILSGIWRTSYQNERETGRLMAIICVKFDSEKKSMALVNSSGEIMECTRDFAVFIKETGFLMERNMSKSVVWKGKWRENRVIASKSTWKVSENCKIACIYLHKTVNPALIPSIKAAKEQKSVFSSLFNTIILPKRGEIGLSEKETEGIFPTRSLETSSISISTAVFHHHELKSTLKWLKRALVHALLFTFLCGSTLTLSLVEFSVVSTLQVNDSLSDITSIGMRVLSVRAAIRSKELYLVNSAFQLYGNQTAARLDLISIAESMKTMHGYLYGNSSEASGDYYEQLLSPVNTYWRYEGHSYQRYEVSLLDLIDEIVRRSIRLAQCPLENITLQNEDFMTLYRNGATEALKVFNSTVAIFGESKDQKRAAMVEVVQLASLICSISSLLLCGIAVGGLLYLLEKRQRRMWTNLLNLPRNLLKKARESVKSRLQSFDLFEFFTEKVSTKSQLCTYESSGSLKSLACVSLFYCCLMCLSTLVLWQYSYSLINPVLQSKPGYIDWLGMRRAVTAKSWFHMREAWLPFNLSFPAIVPDWQPIYSPLQHWEEGNNLLLSLQHCLVYGCSFHTKPPMYQSDSHKDWLMGTSGLDTPLTAGLTPFLSEIAQISSSARADLRSTPKPDYSKGKRLEKYTSLAFAAITKSNQLFDEDTGTQLQAVCGLLKRVSFVVVCAGLLVLLFCGLPLTYIVRNMKVVKRYDREIDAITFPMVSVALLAARK